MINLTLTLSFFHPRHSAGHLPASTAYLSQLRGQTAHSERQRVFSRLPGESAEEVQAGDQAVQGGQRVDLRRKEPLPTQSHQAESGVQSYAERTKGDLSKRLLCAGLSHNQAGRFRFLENTFWQ